jgi:putative multiple sugar transport system substrate-binding protein
MNKVSKVLIALLVLTLAIALPLSAAPTGKAGKVGIAMPTKSLQRWNQDGNYLQDKLEAKGYYVILQYANNQVATQVSQLENMITSGVGTLVIASIDGTALKGVLAQAAKAGVKVIAYDRLIKGTPNCDYYATFDNYLVGKIQGDFIIQKLGLADGKGPFNMECFGGSPDDNNAFLFNKGAMDQLQKYIDSGKLVVNSKQTDMKQIAIQSWKAETAQARMDNLLTAFYADKKVDVVLSPNDSLAQGIAASLKAAGYGTASKPNPVLTGQDCDTANMKLILAGQQSMSIFKDTRTLAERVVTMIEEMAAGKKVTVNDVKSYNNDVKIIPSYLCEPVFADASNYKKILIDSGYYTEAQLK